MTVTQDRGFRSIFKILHFIFLVTKKFEILYMKGLCRNLLNFSQVFLEVLGHSEGLDPLGAENLGHLLVGGEELLVIGVLEVVLLDVSPQLLDALGTAGLLFTNDIGEFIAKLHGLGKSTFFLFFGHLDNNIFQII